jgi:DNA-directed RNA polymerase subunit M
MHTAGDTWVCRSCEHEEPRDSQAEAAVATEDGQQDDGAPDVADASRDAAETMAEPCPTEDCDGERANDEMLPKPGGSCEVLPFTCVECGHRWRET